MAKALTYKDSRTSITFYVESDGRHVAAIDAQGTLLWVRNPFEDKHPLCPYRTPRPVIYRLEAAENSPRLAQAIKARGGDPGHTFLNVTFDSSQFGLVDETNGDFFFGGQD